MDMEEINEKLIVCASDNSTSRVEAYKSILRKVATQPNLGSWGTKISKEDVKRIANNVKGDLKIEDMYTVYETIGFFGCFLKNEHFMNFFSPAEEQELFNCLIDGLKNPKDKRTLLRALWGLAQSKFGCDIYSRNIKEILSVMKQILILDQNPVTIGEGLQLFNSLMESCPDDMKANTSIWFPLVYQYFFHDASKVRSSSHSTMILLKGLYQNDSIEKLYIHIEPYMEDLRKIHCKKMVKHLEEFCLYTLRLWKMLIAILGKNLHPGTTLINSLLEVVEKAFKSPRPECRVEAFKCWQTLISNFSLDPKVLNHPKRMKLLVAPFKSNNAKSEEIAQTKLTAWLHLIRCLNDRASEHFELVIIPLLRYCFNTEGGLSGMNRSFVTSNPSSPARKFPGLHIKSVEILILLMCKEKPKYTQYKFSISDLNNPITPQVLLKNYQVIFKCVLDALILLSDNANNLNLGNILIICVAKHVQNLLTTDSHRRECIEMFKELLSISSGLNIAEGEENMFLLPFIRVFIEGEYVIPLNVLNSSQYNLATGQKIQELMSGTLSNFFIHTLLKPSLSNKLHSKEYKNLWETLLKKSNPPSGKLNFFEFVIDEINKSNLASEPLKVDGVLDLWILTLSYLIQYIQDEGTIDQGDSSEYNWSCLYKYVLFPIKNAEDLAVLSKKSSFTEKIVDNLTKIWNEFTIRCEKTLTAEPMTECDFVCKEMLSILSDKYTGPSDLYAFSIYIMANLLCIMAHQIRFKDIGKKSIKAMQSPAKLRSKQHALHNVGSCLDLLCVLLNKCTRMTDSIRSRVMDKVATTAVILLTNIPKKYAWPMVSALADGLYSSLQINPSAKYTSEVEARFVSMWDAYLSCVEEHVGKLISSEQLLKLAPVLSGAMKISHSGIKEKTIDFWSNNYSSIKLNIPAALFSTLKAEGLSPANLYATPKSIPLSKTPNRTNGISPLPEKKSPKKTPKSVPKKSIYEMTEDEFVKVESPVVRKRLLTAHQAEKMKERCEDIPALYSDLSQTSSQLANCFATQDSFDVSNMESKLPTKKNRRLFAEPSSDALNFKGKIKNESTPTKNKSPVSTPNKQKVSNDTPSKKDKKNPVSTPNKQKVSNDTPSKKDKELGDALKEASFEFEEEKEVDQGTKIIDEKDETEVVKDTKLNKKTLVESVSVTKTPERQSRPSRKRKAESPSKKTIEDVRKSLKGNKFDNTGKLEGKEENKTATPLKSRRLLIKINSDKDIDIKNVVDSPRRKPKGIVNTNSVSANPSNIEGKDDNQNKIEVNKGKAETPLRSYRAKNSANIAIETPNKAKDISEPQIETPRRKSRGDVSKKFDFSDILEDIKRSETPTKSKLQKTASKSKTDDGTAPENISNTETIDDTTPMKGKSASQKIDSDSEDEIPSSQVEEASLSKSFKSIKDTPNFSDRPKRNKRKIDSDEFVYTTPSKKSKLSPTNESDIAKQSPIVKENGTQNTSPNDGSDIIVIESDESMEISNEIIYDKSEKEAKHKKKPRHTEADKLKEENFDYDPTMSTPTKKTRSGRRIVAPSKEMPRPMTPSSKSLDNLDKKVVNSSQKDSPIKTDNQDTEGKRKTKRKLNAFLEKTLSSSESLEVSQSSSESLEVSQSLLLDKANSSESFEEDFSDNKSSDGSLIKENIVEGKNISVKKIEKKLTRLNSFEFSVSSEKTSEDQGIDKEKTIESNINTELEDEKLHKSPKKKSKQVELENENSIESITKSPKTIADGDINAVMSPKSKSPSFIPGNNLSDCVNKKNSPMKSLVMTRQKSQDLSESLKENDFEVFQSINDSSKSIAKPSELTDSLVNGEIRVSPRKNRTKLITNSDSSPAKLKKSLDSKDEIVEDKILNVIPVRSSPRKFASLSKALSSSSTGSPLASPLVSPTKKSPKYLKHLPTTSDESDVFINNNNNYDDGKIDHFNNQFESFAKDNIWDVSSPKKSPSKTRISENKQVNDDDDVSKNIETMKSPNKEKIVANSCSDSDADISVNESVDEEMNEISADVKDALVVDKKSPSKQILVSPISQSKTKSPLKTVVVLSNANMVSPNSRNILCVQTKNSVSPKHDNKNHNGINSPRPKRKSDLGVETSSPAHEKSSPITRKDKSPEKQKLSSPSQQKSPVKQKDKQSPLTERGSNIYNILNSASDGERTSPQIVSRLAESVSTPELRRKPRFAQGSRAAAMLAKAQKNNKRNRNSEDESPVSQLRTLKQSGETTPVVNKHSVDTTPVVKSADGERNKPWARFSPKSEASPSTGILSLKSPLNAPRNRRRVSFADPPVSDSVEIPPSPRNTKGKKAQKKLDMTPTSCNTPLLETEASPLLEINKEASSTRILDSSKPIFPELLNCPKPIDDIVHLLVPSTQAASLANVFKRSCVSTIGDIAQLTESELHMYPLESPKTEKTLECLRRFAENHSITYSNSEVDDSKMDTSESNEISKKEAILSDEDFVRELNSRLHEKSSLLRNITETLSADNCEELMRNLVRFIPYSRVIDIYSEFLKEKNS